MCRAKNGAGCILSLLSKTKPYVQQAITFVSRTLAKPLVQLRLPTHYSGAEFVGLAFVCSIEISRQMTQAMQRRFFSVLI